MNLRRVIILSALGILALIYIFPVALLDTLSRNLAQDYVSYVDSRMEISNPSKSSDYIVSQYQPDYEAYVVSHDDLYIAYRSRSRNESISVWGKNHYFKFGVSQRRLVPVSSPASITIRKRTETVSPAPSLAFPIDINTRIIRIDIDTDEVTIGIGQLCFSATLLPPQCWQISHFPEKDRVILKAFDLHSDQWIESVWSTHHLEANADSLDLDNKYTSFTKTGNDPYLVSNNYFQYEVRSEWLRSSESVAHVFYFVLPLLVVLVIMILIAAPSLFCISKKYLCSPPRHLRQPVRSTITIDFLLRTSNSSIFAHSLLAFLFVGLAVTVNIFHLTPEHDAITYHGIWHYFASSIQEGVLPLWNPYTLTGTPFYPDLQTYGHLVFTHFIFLLLQILSDGTTLASYVNHYLFWYYLFIVGTYLSLRIITKDNRTSLFFTLVLILSAFPMVSRQAGTLNFIVFIPLITYFFLLFSREHNPHKKGLYFFVMSFLLSISTLIYIPVGIIFHILFLVLLSLVFRTPYLRNITRFLSTIPGLSWLALSIFVAVVICTPVFVLYFELFKEAELVPAVRLPFYVQAFSSDIDFGEFFTNVPTHSITLGDLTGLLISMNSNLFFKTLTSPQISEIFLFVTVLLLFFVLRCLRVSLNHYGHVFIVMTVLCLFTMSNFGTTGADPLAISQRAMILIVPFLERFEAFQNFGLLFIFYLILTAAVGFKTLEQGSKTTRLIWIVLLFLPLANYTYLLFQEGDRRIYFLDLPMTAYLGYIFCLLVAGLIILIGFRRNTFVSINFLKFATVIVVLAELLLVDYSYSKTRMPSHQSYFSTLQSQGILETKHEPSFLNYRVPTMIGANILFGPGIFHATKTAFPEGKLFYFTDHYYDHLVNVDINKQLATSSVVYPILRFIPTDKAVFLPDKYAVVDTINQTSLTDLGTTIFIENNTNEEHTVKRKSFRDIDDRLVIPKESGGDNIALQIQAQNAFDQLKGFTSIEKSQAPFEIVDFNANQIIMNVSATEDGYVFFGDGFHKHWKSFVDGEKQPIYKTNINFKSVFVPKGKHSVIFQFDPKPFKYAAIGSIIAQFSAFLFILLTLWILSRNSPIFAKRTY